MDRGSMFGPDGNFSGCFCPVANIFTFVPPTSIARTFMFLFLCKVQVNSEFTQLQASACCLASVDARAHKAVEIVVGPRSQEGEENNPRSGPWTDCA